MGMRKHFYQLTNRLTKSNRSEISECKILMSRDYLDKSIETSYLNILMYFY